MKKAFISLYVLVALLGISLNSFASGNETHRTSTINVKVPCTMNENNLLTAPNEQQVLYYSNLACGKRSGNSFAISVEPSEASAGINCFNRNRYQIALIGPPKVQYKVECGTVAVGDLSDIMNP